MGRITKGSQGICIQLPLKSQKLLITGQNQQLQCIVMLSAGHLVQVKRVKIGMIMTDLDR